MSLRHILLGLLEEPASGYDLGKAFEATAAHFWSAHLSQIYPTLKRLEEKGWLTSRQEASEQGPDRTVYRRTEAGREALGAWLRDEPQVDEPRLAYLGQLYFMAEADDPEVTARFLRRLRERFRERLAALEAIERHWTEHDPRFPDDLPDAGFHMHATLRCGLRVNRARIAWCEETLERLERRGDTSDAPATPDPSADARDGDGSPSAAAGGPSSPETGASP